MSFKEQWGKIDEKWFSLFLAIATIAAVNFMLPGNQLALLEIVMLKLVYVVCLLVTTVSVIYFFRGTKYDIYEEIFETGNTAAAMLVAGLFIAIALVIGK